MLSAFFSLHIILTRVIPRVCLPWVKIVRDFELGHDDEDRAEVVHPEVYSTLKSD